MSTLTLEVEEDLLREAARVAEQRNTTVDRLVHEYLRSLLGQQERRREGWERFKRMMHENPIEVGERTWTREDLYER